MILCLMFEVIIFFKSNFGRGIAFLSNCNKPVCALGFLKPGQPSNYGTKKITQFLCEVHSYPI